MSGAGVVIGSLDFVAGSGCKLSPSLFILLSTAASFEQIVDFLLHMSQVAESSLEY